MVIDTKMERQKIKCELYHDNFQNYKRYNIPKAQLVIADIPYNTGNNAYASNPMWYEGGDLVNGESKFANKVFFDSDVSFNIYEYFHFCSKLLKPEPKEAGKAPAMIIFCAYEQQDMLIKEAKRLGFNGYIPISFIKNYSPQVLKANMRIVGATEYAIVFYRQKLPKFNNKGKMVFDWFKYESDSKQIPKIHPTQKPVKILKRLIEIFTDEGDVVIDPVAGSGTTLRAAYELNRNSYGFEKNKEFYRKAKEQMLTGLTVDELEKKEIGYISLFD